MLRIIIAAIIGFVIWSILWVGSDAVFMAISLWYRESIEGLQKAVETNTSFNVSLTMLIISLIRSVIFSIISGLITAIISKESFKAPIILGVLLLAFGIFIQSIYWNYIPLWYHISFLLLLIPMTILGGKLSKKGNG